MSRELRNFLETGIAYTGKESSREGVTLTERGNDLGLFHVGLDERPAPTCGHHTYNQVRESPTLSLSRVLVF